MVHQVCPLVSQGLTTSRQQRGGQYINTGIKYNTTGKVNYKLEIKFNIPSVVSSNQYSGCDGFFTGIQSNGCYVGTSVKYTEGTDCIAQTFNTWANDTDEYYQKLYTYKGSTSATATYQASYMVNDSIAIGNLGTSYRSYCCQNWKIYYLKLWRDDELVFDGVPALDSNAKPCMYDLITKQPFYNKGSGEFLYG